MKQIKFYLYETPITSVLLFLSLFRWQHFQIEGPPAWAKPSKKNNHISSDQNAYFSFIMK